MTFASLASWAIDALLASALLMAAVLLVREPVRRQFGAEVAYTLWALPVLRLALPPVPAGWFGVAGLPMARAGASMTVLAGGAAPFAADRIVTPLVGTGTVLAGCWAAGAAGLFAFHAWRHRRFCRRILATADPIGRAGTVRIVASDGAPGPLAFGLVSRYVAIPRDLSLHYDDDERALALAHELGHHQRGDLVANWVALATLALHWPNPLAWHAFRAFRVDQEMANDARVLAGRSDADRHVYACAIVKAAGGGPIVAECHLQSPGDLKGRLRRLTTARASRGRLLAGAMAVSALMAAGLVLTASGSDVATPAEADHRVLVADTPIREPRLPAVAAPARGRAAPVLALAERPPRHRHTVAAARTEPSSAVEVAAVAATGHADLLPVVSALAPVGTVFSTSCLIALRPVLDGSPPERVSLCVNRIEQASPGAHGPGRIESVAFWRMSADAVPPAEAVTGPASIVPGGRALLDQSGQQRPAPGLASRLQ